MDITSSYVAPNAINQPKISAETDRTEIRAVAEKFESMFLSEMMKPMFEAVGSEDPIFGGGHAEKMFQSMMVDEYGQSISARGGIGIADDIERQLLQLQEVK